MGIIFPEIPGGSAKRERGASSLTEQERCRGRQAAPASAAGHLRPFWGGRIGEGAAVTGLVKQEELSDRAPTFQLEEARVPEGGGGSGGAERTGWTRERLRRWGAPACLGRNQGAVKGFSQPWR